MNVALLLKYLTVPYSPFFCDDVRGETASVRRRCEGTDTGVVTYREAPTDPTTDQKDEGLLPDHSWLWVQLKLQKAKLPRRRDYCTLPRCSSVGTEQSQLVLDALPSGCQPARAAPKDANVSFEI